MGELAGDKCIIRKRATRCILPRKSPRDRFRTLNTDRVRPDVEGGQRGAEKTVIQRAAEGKPLVLSLWASCEGADCTIRNCVASFILPRKSTRDRFRTLNTERVIADVERGQRGADQTVKKRAEEGKWGS